MRQITYVLVVVGVVAFTAESSLAQTQGLFNQGGTTQQGGGAQGQGGLGQGGLGQGGLGQGGLGQGASSGIQLNEIGTLGSQVGQNQFTGQANTGEFVGGRDVGQGQTGTNPRFQQADGGQGFQQPDNDQRSERRIRPRYRVSFDYESVAPTAVADRSRQHVRTFQTTYNLPDSISVELDETGTAVLRGSAVSDEMRRLIAHVVRMEPGVRAVQNELILAEEAE